MMGASQVLSRLLLLVTFVGWLAGSSWAQETARVRVALAPVYLSPNTQSEQVTQVLLWDRVEVVGQRNGWAQVWVPDQYREALGYPGWVASEALRTSAPDLTGPTVAAAYPKISLRAGPDTEAEVVMAVFMSTRLPVVLAAGQTSVDQARRTVDGENWYPVRLPDRREPAWVRASQVQIEAIPALSAGSGIIEDARRFRGTPYEWGGMSQRGIDCSGLIYVSYRISGITVPRDADQQFQVGLPITPENLQPGDMVFFGRPGEIVHVGLYAGEGLLLHASSGAGVVLSPLFTGWYKENYQGARRILDQASSKPKVLRPQTTPASKP